MRVNICRVPRKRFEQEAAGIETNMFDRYSCILYDSMKTLVEDA